MPDIYRERVLNGPEPVHVIQEDGDVVAYHHTRPYFEAAHVVVVPKLHVESLLDPAADPLLPHLLEVVRDVARYVLTAHGAARVLTNLGDYQDSKHLHWHVSAGPPLPQPTARPRTGVERAVLPRGQPPSASRPG